MPRYNGSMPDIDLLEILSEVPDFEHCVVIFPDRDMLRRAFQPFVGQYDPVYRTHCLHRAEYLEDRKRKARLYLRTPKQILVANRNRAIDGAVRAYVVPGVEVTDMMTVNMLASGIKEILPTDAVGLI